MLFHYQQPWTPVILTGILVHHLHIIILRISVFVFVSVWKGTGHLKLLGLVIKRHLDLSCLIEVENDTVGKKMFVMCFWSLEQGVKGVLIRN